MDERQILLNSIKTPDGTILVSRHRHDYASHVDDNGETYIVDGGNDYLKRFYNDVIAEELSIYDDDPFEVIRNNFVRWDSRTLQYTLLCDMSDEWLDNTISFYEKQIYNTIHLYMREKAFRRDIKIDEILK